MISVLGFPDIATKWFILKIFLQTIMIMIKADISITHMSIGFGCYHFKCFTSKMFFF